MKLVLRIALALLILASGSRVTRQLVSYRLLQEAETVEEMEAALRWNSSNPELHSDLGQDYRDSLSIQDLALTRDFFERAAELNPYLQRYRIQLAEVYELLGDPVRAEAEFAAAAELKPRQAGGRWWLANFLLRTDQVERSLEPFRRALAVESLLTRPALGLLLRAGATLEQIESVLPPDPQAFRASLELACELTAVDEQAEAARQLERRMWIRLISANPPPSAEDGDFYVVHLLDSGRFDEARERWIELERANDRVDEAFSAKKNYIWNGGFEGSLSRASLDWSLRSSDAFTVQRVEGEGSSGAALRVDFNGTENVNFWGARQEVVVERGATYELSFVARSRGLTTDRGLYFEVIDSPTQRVLAGTEEITGTTAERRYSLAFRVPEGRRRVLVCLRRKPSDHIDNQIDGSLWLDSVALTPTGP